MLFKRLALVALLSIGLIGPTSALAASGNAPSNVVAVADGSGVRYQYQKVSRHGMTVRIPVGVRWVQDKGSNWGKYETVTSTGERFSFRSYALSPNEPVYTGASILLDKIYGGATVLASSYSSIDSPRFDGEHLTISKKVRLKNGRIAYFVLRTDTYRGVSRAHVVEWQGTARQAVSSLQDRRHFLDFYQLVNSK